MAITARDLFAGFARTKALVVGDVMVDAYLWGRVDRISPEAPVPVVHVTERSERLGGAANVALNLHALGAIPIVASVIGQDTAADRIMELFKQASLPTEGLVRSPRRKTTIKTRVIAGHQHIVRVDDEQDADLGTADEDALVSTVSSLLEQQRPDVLVFEDYDKGVLTANGIARIIAAAKAVGVPVAVDPKKRNFFAYSGVDLFKPNLKELREGLKIDVTAGDREAVRHAVAQLEKRLGNTTSLITLSEHGVYARRGAEEVALPAHKREIADVSGAGDTVIAVAALCLAAGTDLHTLASLANLAGGLVCEHVGVVPVDRAHLLHESALLATAKA